MLLKTQDLIFVPVFAPAARIPVLSVPLCNEKPGDPGSHVVVPRHYAHYIIQYSMQYLDHRSQYTVQYVDHRSDSSGEIKCSLTNRKMFP